MTIGPIYGGFFADLFGMEATFISSFFIVLVSAILLALFLKEIERVD